jgi:hypothetical protein
MIDSSVKQNGKLDLKQKAKSLGIDVSTIIDELKVRISAIQDQEEYYTYSKKISSEFILGIAQYVKKYQLRRLNIGRIDTDGPGELSIWVNTDGDIVQECPTCMESKPVSFDYIHFYLDKPNQIVRNLIWTIVNSYEDRRKEMETYCSSINEL